MKLSIIIVNYNVKHFLELTLQSVFAAIKEIQAEVIVVDNNSMDSSKEFIENHYNASDYQNLKWISLSENVGFSKGNNIGLKEANGEFLLLLNPDTIVAEDTFKKCIEFMDNNPVCGALGVKMIDGKGKFLPESKRGLPSPSTAIFKMIGLSKLFPKSKIWNRYHLGYLPNNEINEVEVLSGAFFFTRKEVLDKIGLLDEAFFMYGEDIDLSYRVLLGGYKNYYFPDTEIVHFKGESTKKQSMKYVKVFYGAMQIFVKKHFAGKGAKVVSLLLSIAIFLRAGMALLQRVGKTLFIPILDFGIILLGFLGITKYWEGYNKWVLAIYPDSFYHFVIPFYILILILFIALSGGYTRPFKLKKINRGLLVGGIILFGIYGLAPKSMQFSRAILGLGIAWSFLATLLLRMALQFIKYGNFDLGKKNASYSIIVGHSQDVSEYLEGQESGFFNLGVKGLITIEQEPLKKSIIHLGFLKNIKHLIHLYSINEIQFCLGNLSFKNIIKTMATTSLEVLDDNLQFKFIEQKKKYLISGGSKNELSSLWSLDASPLILDREILFKKKLSDKCIAIVLIVISPYLLIRGKTKLIKDLFRVLFGSYTWVGPTIASINHNVGKSLYSPVVYKNISPKDEYNLQYNYLSDYDIRKDIKVMFHQIFY